MNNISTSFPKPTPTAGLKPPEPTRPKVGLNIEWKSVDRLRVDPRAEAIPPMDPDDYDALVLDIEANGINEPIVLAGFMDGKDEPGTVRLLDGRHRLMIARTLGWRQVPVRYFSSDHPDEEFAFMVRAALNRRHLTPKQRQDLAAKLIAAAPERSDRSIAKATGISRPTVAKVRDELVDGGQVAEVATSTGADGKSYPRPAPKAAPGRQATDLPEESAQIKANRWYRLREAIGPVLALVGYEEQYAAGVPDKNRSAMAKRLRKAGSAFARIAYELERGADRVSAEHVITEEAAIVWLRDLDELAGSWLRESTTTTRYRRGRLRDM